MDDCDPVYPDEDGGDEPRPALSRRVLLAGSAATGATATASCLWSDETDSDDNDGPGPWDVTIHPDGEYAYVPDLFGDTLTVIHIESFTVENQVAVEPTNGAPTEPWTGTVSWDGSTLLVENNGGDGGTESILDASDPANPVERHRLGQNDGLGAGHSRAKSAPSRRMATCSLVRARM